MGTRRGMHEEMHERNIRGARGGTKEQTYWEHYECTGGVREDRLETHKECIGLRITERTRNTRGRERRELGGKVRRLHRKRMKNARRNAWRNPQLM